VDVRLPGELSTDPDGSCPVDDCRNVDGAGPGDTFLEEEVVAVEPGFHAVWSLTLGGEAADRGVIVRALDDGSMVLAGESDSAQFAAGGLAFDKPFPDVWSWDVFVASLDAYGNAAWGELLGGSANDSVNGLSVAADGTIYVACNYESPDFAFAGAVLPHSGDFDLLLMALDADGAALWSLAAGGPSMDVAFGVAAAPEGGVYLTGFIGSDGVDLGTGPLEHSGADGIPDGFLAKLTADGSVAWAESFGGAGSEVPRTVTMAPDGNVVLIGSFESPTLLLGETALKNRGGSDIFVATFTPDGEVAWAKAWGGLEHDAPHAVALTPAGSIVVTGSYQSYDLDFGGGKLPNASAPGYHDLFLLALAPDGTHLWSKGFGGVGWDLGKALAVAADGTLWLGGSFSSPQLVLGTALAGPQDEETNASDMFLARFSGDGTPLAEAAFSGNGMDYAYFLSPAPDGSVLVTGFFDSSPSNAATDPGPLDLGNGPLPQLGAIDVLLARLAPGEGGP
jgi:hypothetical protein